MREFLFDTLETALMAMVIFLLLQAAIQNFRVEGPSMVPTLNHGEHLLVNKLVYLRVPSAIAGLVPGLSDDPNASHYLFQEPRRTEVLVFHFPEDPDRDFVKRIIGVPGDTVALEQGRVFLNGRPMDEPYIVNRGASNMAPVRVPPKNYLRSGRQPPTEQRLADLELHLRPRVGDRGEGLVHLLAVRQPGPRAPPLLGRRLARLARSRSPRPGHQSTGASAPTRRPHPARACGGCTIGGRAVSSVGRAPDF